MAWWLIMHVIIALPVLALSVWLGGCSRASQAAYAKPETFREPPKLTKVTEVKPEPSPSPNASVHPPTTAEITLAAEAMAQEALKDIIASQIPSQGFACDHQARSAMWQPRKPTRSFGFCTARTQAIA